ncbi:cytochrome P450 2U1-like [Clavelina lepadiformis]|uniref:cytochrome P450 2U1-like n=1 Tax=Clavelina lepadiformis TaxID=159417 RepID=UPI004042C17E
MFWYILFVVLLLLTYYWYQRPNKFPSGPRGLPVIGVAPFQGKHPYKTYMKWSKEYGPILSVRLGRNDAVILNDYDSVQQAFGARNTVFSGRPPNGFLDKLFEGHGIVFMDYGENWKSQRKFGLFTLRGLGVGKKTMEERVFEEVAYFKDEIKANNGKPFDILTSLKKAVSNNICSVAYGSRFDYNDPIFNELIHNLDNIFNTPEIISTIAFMFLIPILRHIPPFSSRSKRMLSIMDKIVGVQKDIIKDHQNSLDNGNVRDFIDAFLVEIKNKTHSSFTEKQLVYYILNLFVAGTETVTQTVRWGLLSLIHYPQIQKKLYEEIDSVLGSDGKVTMSHRTTMPYVCAFVEEILRCRPAASIGLPHMATDDAEVNGFSIPKGTQVFANIWAVHHDENIWDEPEKFKPERHLDEKGNFVMSHRVIPFSMGPRHCLGEQLARMEIFIFLVSTLQGFEILPDPDKSDLPIFHDSVPGLNVIAFPFRLVAKQR